MCQVCVMTGWGREGSGSTVVLVGVYTSPSLHTGSILGLDINDSKIYIVGEVEVKLTQN